MTFVVELIVMAVVLLFLLLGIMSWLAYEEHPKMYNILTKITIGLFIILCIVELYWVISLN